MRRETWSVPVVVCGAFDVLKSEFTDRIPIHAGSSVSWEMKTPHLYCISDHSRIAISTHSIIVAIVMWALHVKE